MHGSPAGTFAKSGCQNGKTNSSAKAAAPNLESPKMAPWYMAMTQNQRLASSYSLFRGTLPTQKLGEKGHWPLLKNHPLKLKGKIAGYCAVNWDPNSVGFFGFLF